MLFEHVDHGIELPKLQQITPPTGPRIYVTPEGNRYPSVTSVLGSMDKGDGLEKWKKRVGEKEAAGILRQAGQRGTIIHETLEKYLKNNSTYKKGLMPVDRMHIQELKKYVNRINNILFLEERLYSDYLKVAGTVDCIAEFDGVLSIIDFKTSRSLKQEEHCKGYFMQGSAYAACFKELTGHAVKQVVIIMVVNNDDPQLFKVRVSDHLRDFIKVRLACNF